MNKNILIMQEEEMDCGIACLAMICLFYNMPYSLNHLKTIMKYNNSKGTNFLELYNTGKLLGFQMKCIRSINKKLNMVLNLPCIAQIQIIDGVHHFIVIHDISKSHIEIADPSKGIKIIEKNIFYKYFTGYLLEFYVSSK